MDVVFRGGGVGIFVSGIKHPVSAAELRLPLNGTGRSFQQLGAVQKQTALE